MPQTENNNYHDNGTLFYLFLEPKIRFQSIRRVVDENTDVCKVTVRRTGSDLSRPSSVVVRSKRTNPVSAEGMNRMIDELGFAVVSSYKAMRQKIDIY